MRTLPTSIAACLLVVSAAAHAQPAEPPAKVVVLPERAEAIYQHYHYAPAIRVGERVILSGIPAAGPGSYRDQVKRLFLTTQAILKAAGATMADVIEIQTFHTGPKSSAEFEKELGEFLEVHKEHFTAHYPAWTAIGNAVLLAPGATVEMRVEAIIGSGTRARLEKIPAGTVSTR